MTSWGCIVIKIIKCQLTILICILFELGLNSARFGRPVFNLLTRFNRNKNNKVIINIVSNFVQISEGSFPDFASIEQRSIDY